MMEPRQSTVENTKKVCLNCGTELLDRFCGNCGQDSQEFKLSVWRLFGQFFDSITEFDSKFFRSIIPLFFRPGYLTKQFLAGKRKSFLNPIQMYVFCSFIFFLTVSLVADDTIDNEINFTSDKSDSKNLVSFQLGEDSAGLDKEQIEVIKESAGEAKKDKSIKNELSIKWYDSKAKTAREYDSLQMNLSSSARDGFVKSLLVRKSMSLEHKYKNNTSGFILALIQNFKENLPNLTFFLLPFFALLLMLLYVRRRFFYVEHLLFSVHVHCFIFSFTTIWLLLDFFIPMHESIKGAFIWIIFGYLFVAMKRMYEQSWRKTFAKLVMFSFMYLILLIFGIVANLLISLFFVEA